MTFQIPIHEAILRRAARKQEGRFCVNCGSVAGPLKVSLVARTHWGLETLVLQCKDCDKVWRPKSGSIDAVRDPLDYSTGHVHTHIKTGMLD